MIRNYDENALLESSGIALLINFILSVYIFEFVLHHRFSAILVVEIMFPIRHLQCEQRSARTPLELK